MSKLMCWIRRNKLWAGFVVVFIPLVIILGLQTWSLVRLEKLVPVADKSRLKDFLWTLSSEIQDHYHSRAQQILDIPPHAFNRDKDVAPQAVVSRDQLLDTVWGYENFPLTRTVDMHIAKLRQKIEDCPNDPRFIVTLHRVGYKFTG
jgi:Transcriptional regulatory protein, C terminal